MEQSYTDFAASQGAAIQVEASYMPEQKRDGLRKRLLKRDGKKFHKYVTSTSTHGVQRMFTGKSKIRRAMWILLFLGSVTALSYTVVTSFITYFQTPTSTSVTTRHVEALEFPSVTICNFNPYQASFVRENNLTQLISQTFNLRLEDGMDIQEYCSNVAASVQGPSQTLKEVAFEARQKKRDFILDCNFRGIVCTEREVVPDFNVFGYCYSFNSDPEREVKKVFGGGFRHDLELVLNIDQQEYAGSFDKEAGVYVVVHERGTPPIIFGHGVVIAPPGLSTYVSIQKKLIDDRSDLGHCTSEAKFAPFKLLNASYSLSSCVFDCVLVQIAEVCGCIHNMVDPPASGDYSDLPPCDIAKLCCVVATLTSAEECSCNLGCNHTLYDIATSYSTFPSRKSVVDISEQYNISIDTIQDDLVGVHVYFEELVLENEVTVRSYSARDLVSDIGGQLGLFIGASIISMTEFFVWVFDEIKDRCFGVKERDINRVFVNANAKDSLRSMRNGSVVTSSTIEVDSDTDDDDG